MTAPKGRRPRPARGPSAAAEAGPEFAPGLCWDSWPGAWEPACPPFRSVRSGRLPGPPTLPQLPESRAPRGDQTGAPGMRCARPPRPRPLGGDRNSPRALGTSRLPASERLLHPPAGRWLAGTFRVGRLGDPVLQA